MALVGGYTLLLGEIPRLTANADGLGVLSSSNKCRPFDADADGTIIGEGGGFVMLKPIEAAIKDCDVIHGVILGSALNQDAARSNGLVAPSPDAQAQVIADALRNSDIEATAIQYVEAHGTGTKIGDPIEMSGLLQTYGNCQRTSGPCYVSSSKGNFGHLDAMAGFVGLIRILTQLRYGRLYPTANYKSQNPLLGKMSEALKISQESRPWIAHGLLRCAGLSSYGLSGTNAHTVVQEAPNLEAPQPEDDECIIVISGRDEAAALDLANKLARTIADTTDAKFDIAAASDVLQRGREHFEFRLAWIVKNTSELKQRFKFCDAA